MSEYKIQRNGEITYTAAGLKNLDQYVQDLIVIYLNYLIIIYTADKPVL